ncbi:hypothetical protein WICPIJ_001122 [Wickerhamomyces pijperi]|uniref:Nitrogen permease regulator 2 n=1 Tax=Wickerhamomyces pijperi TaxID=599730 RepID=A0A9P8TR18_WICPI|nr:hypothetical protein WICPIJ_001122 [Wickerhamomyces pijperi]
MADFEEGFAPLEAIFYTVFHPTEGTKVLHQVPEGSIIPTSEYPNSALFDFDLVKNYVIPKSQLCDRLVTFKIDQYRLVGYPVSINASHYARNSFSFNFCFVFNYTDKSESYEPSIRRTGRIFKNLEEQYQILSKMTNDMIYFKDSSSKSKDPDHVLNNDDIMAQRSLSMESTFTMNSQNNTYNQILNDLELKTNSSTPLGITNKDGNIIKLESVENLLQQIYQDLNNYSECLIPIDSGNAIDIKLLPLLPPPPRVNAEDVPISTVNLHNLVDVNWDPTMLKILPYINGINSIKRISVLANADQNIVKSCIQHLLYYKCIIITDIFQFSNIYAPTSNINLFLTDSHMALECQSYVVTTAIFDGKPFESPPSSSSAATATAANNEPSSSASSRFHTLRSSNASSAVNLLGAFSSGLGRIESIELPTKSKLFYLYRSLHQGQTVKHWYREHLQDLKYIDVRRFLSFGILRGLIYRIHSFPIIEALLQSTEHTNHVFNASNNVFAKETKTPAVNHKMFNPSYLSNMTNSKLSNLTETQKKQIELLKLYLHGMKSFDAICTEMEMGRASVDSLLRKIGAYNVVNC